MRLTVLGSGPALPRPGGACSGYLVEAGGARLLLDCGSGVLSNLMLVADFRAIDAIVLSHWHADHWFDLVPYRYGLMLTQKPAPRRPDLLLPPGGSAVLEGVTKAFDPTGAFFGKYFAVSEYDPEREHSIGSLRLSFARTRHVLPTWAIRVSGDGGVLVYSADTGPSDEVERLAKDADVLLCEATLLGAGDQSPTALHLSAAQAGQLAARSGVRRLLLTHIWPEADPAQSLAEASEHFPSVALARELETHDI